jgi:hypothetical protein
MYCEYNGEYINEDDCEECSRLGSCKQYRRSEERNKQLEHLRNNEVIQQTKRKLLATIGMDEIAIDNCLDNLCSAIFKDYQSWITANILDVIENRILEYIDNNVKSYVEECFAKATSEMVLEISKDGKPMVTTIQETIVKQFTAFLKKTDSNRRNIIERNINDAINRKVTDMANEALAELKKETVEKFEKEAMKKMMEGMAKAINQDKRLLSMFGE